MNRATGTRHTGRTSAGLLCGINAMNSKDVLGEIDTDGDNGRYGLPSTNECVDGCCTSHVAPGCRTLFNYRRIARGEVPLFAIPMSQVVPSAIQSTSLPLMMPRRFRPCGGKSHEKTLPWV